MTLVTFRPSDCHGIVAPAPDSISHEPAGYNFQSGYGEVLASFGEAALMPLLTNVIETPTDTPDPYISVHNKATYEAEIDSSLVIGDYQESVPPKIMERTLALASMMCNYSFMIINVTAPPDFVCRQRAPAIHLMRTMGVSTRFFALGRNDTSGLVDAAIANHTNRLTPADQQYPDISDELFDYAQKFSLSCNALEVPLRAADVIVIDE